MVNAQRRWAGVKKSLPRFALLLLPWAQRPHVCSVSQSLEPAPLNRVRQQAACISRLWLSPLLWPHAATEWFHFPRLPGPSRVKRVRLNCPYFVSLSPSFEPRVRQQVQFPRLPEIPALNCVRGSNFARATCRARAHCGRDLRDGSPSTHRCDARAMTH
eukprot:1680282-Pleurochrysis_carterae.AAC.1